MRLNSSYMVYPAKAGVGGLGYQAATAAAGLALAGPLVALGPGRVRDWPLETPDPSGAVWEDAPPVKSSWFARRVFYRRRLGQLVLAHDRSIGRWAAGRLDMASPDLVYSFVQVGLEALEWSRTRGVPTVIDNPNGHIRGFARAYRDEWARWVGGVYRGHPTDAMVARVEREYELADRIRVSSEWAKESMVRNGVPESKVSVCPQPINRVRFAPPPARRPATGPLRIAYVGSLDLRKGFVYLLRAARAIGSHAIQIEFVGQTGDRGSKMLLARERVGLNLTVDSGDPVPAYHRAELFVMPSLEDGFGFVAAEAMACGLPVVVTDQCGAAGWVRPGETGWVVPAGDEAGLAHVIELAISCRARLIEMGRAARRSIEARDPFAAVRELADWSRDRGRAAPAE